MVWEPVVRIMASALWSPSPDSVRPSWSAPVDKTVDVPGMGIFEKGTQGAFRFEVRGIRNGVTPAGGGARCAESMTGARPTGPTHKGQGCHQVLIKGSPDLVISVHGHDAVERGPADGSTTNPYSECHPGGVRRGAGC